MATSECVDHIDDDDMVDEHCNISFNDESHVSLNAESFCERCLSCANMVVAEVNTLLLDVEVRMLVILRMNVHFMEFMREHYVHVVGNQSYLEDDSG